MTESVTSRLPAPSGTNLGSLVMGLDHCLVVVRHGRTEHNDQDRVSTRTDVRLTARGIEQAGELATSLTGVNFDYHWTSPLSRARDTLSIIARAGDSVQATVDKRLIEPDAGPFETHQFEALELATHPLNRAWLEYQDATDPTFPDGATDTARAAAAASEFVTMVSRIPGRHLAVSHGALSRLMVAAFLGMPAANFRLLRLDNCSCAVWKFYPRPPHQLIGWNVQ